jgi:hypothetical protein
MTRQIYAIIGGRGGRRTHAVKRGRLLPLLNLPSRLGTRQQVNRGLRVQTHDLVGGIFLPAPQNSYGL